MIPRICLIIVGLLIGLQHTAAQVSFAPAVNYPVILNHPSGVGSQPDIIVAADINGDGKLDLICGDEEDDQPGNYGYTLSVFTNNGSGVFGSNTTLNVGISPDPIAADIRGVGKVDLICANSGGNTITVLTNNGHGSFSSNATYIVGYSPSSLIAADVNGDGKLDLICANENDDTLTILTNNGTGVFGSNATFFVGGGHLAVVAADIRGVGKPVLTILTNNGGGVFGSNATYNVGTTPESLIAADVNGDGKLDLICANQGDGTLTVLTNDGTGVFGSNTTLHTSTPYSVLAADLNRDGKVDLISGSVNTLTVFTNDGNGNFSSNITLNVVILPLSVVAADVNGDGKLDLISANFFNNSLSVLINTSIFPSPTSMPVLTITPTGNIMRVSWPSASAGWSLQQSPDLTTANWCPSGYSGYSIYDDETNKSLTMPSTPGNIFFRLLHP
jgi:hypothetical protein